MQSLISQYPRSDADDNDLYAYFRTIPYQMQTINHLQHFGNPDIYDNFIAKALVLR